MTSGEAVIGTRHAADESFHLFVVDAFKLVIVAEMARHCGAASA